MSRYGKGNRLENLRRARIKGWSRFALKMLRRKSWRVAMVRPIIAGLLLLAGSAQAMEINGERRVLVMLLNFTNTVQPAFTVANVQTAMALTDKHVIENSYGLADLSYTILNWQRMNIAAPSTGCILNHISNPSITSEGNRLALAQGVNPAVFDHVVYLTPSYSANNCSAGEHDKRPGRVWYETNWPNGSIIAHELFHNFGALEADAYDCGNAALLATGCSALWREAYADIMGTGPMIHTNSAIKESFGWLTAQFADASGDYVIRPLSKYPSALVVPLADGRDLYVEYRQPTGLDAPLGNITGSNLLRGLKLTINGRNTYMLDTTPTSVQFTSDGALEVGQSFAYGDVTVKCMSLNSTQAIVRVTYAP